VYKRQISNSHNIYHPQFWNLWLAMTAVLLALTVISTIAALLITQQEGVALALLCFWVGVWIAVYFVLQNQAAKVSHMMNAREVEALLMKFMKDPLPEAR
jgi:uncharacterized membrane protein